MAPSVNIYVCATITALVIRRLENVSAKIFGMENTVTRFVQTVIGELSVTRCAIAVTVLVIQYQEYVSVTQDLPAIP